MTTPLLSVEKLCVNFGPSRVVDHVSFDIAAGEKFGLVGESGSGKSVTALSILRLVATATYEGAIRFEGEDLLKKSERHMRGIRGREISMIFQEPMTALNPLYTVGNQVSEVLELVGINAERLNSYPHQLSGGMRQRIMIAMALSCNPKLLIADEPTTALDVTIQAQILELLNELKARLKMAIMLITHDMGVIAETAQRVVVMYAAKVAEEASVADLFKEPLHPYTQGLLRSIPRIDLAATERRRLEVIGGTVPTLRGEIAPGCRFAPRCPFVKPVCTEKDPVLKEVKPGHKVSCWLY